MGYKHTSRAIEMVSYDSEHELRRASSIYKLITITPTIYCQPFEVCLSHNAPRRNSHDEKTNHR